jgi:hypothetical protein
MQNSQKKLKKFLYPGNFKHYETTINSYVTKSNKPNFFITSNKNSEKKNPLTPLHSVSESTTLCDSIPQLKKKNYCSFNYKESGERKTENNGTNESEMEKDVSKVSSEHLRITKFKNYLSFLKESSNFNDSVTFKNKTFSDLKRKNGQENDFDNFNIFNGMDKRRSTLLNDLNHRLFYKKTKTLEAYNVNFSTKLLELSSKSLKKEQTLTESSLMKRRFLKKIGSFSPNSKKKNVFNKIKFIDTNVSKNMKNNVNLPSSDNLKYKADPFLLLEVSSFIPTT